jgi:hypothetical protein
MIQEKKHLLAKQRYEKLVQQLTAETTINPYETRKEQEERIARAKVDYEYFVDTYFPHYAQDRCAEFHLSTADLIRKNKFCKLLLGWGRGLAKSTHMNILVPLWLWINGDLKVMLLIGQNNEKANVLLSDLQAEFSGNQRLIHDFGQQMQEGSWEEGRFVTKNDCAFFALGMGQSPRGLRHRQYRPDYIVGDDLDTKIVTKNPKRVREYANWICEDLIPCCDKRGGRYIQVNNVFAPHTILTEVRDTRKGFQYIQVDATDQNGNPTWYQKYTREYYEKLQDDIGTLSFMSEFNNQPYAEGTTFTQDMIQWKELPPLKKYDRIIGQWDVAYSDSPTADYNAIRIWGARKGEYHLIDCFVKQCKMAAAIEWMYVFLGQFPDVFIPIYFESQFWNEALQIVYNELEKKHGYGIPLIRGDRPKGAKIDRIMELHP